MTQLYSRKNVIENLLGHFHLHSIRRKTQRDYVWKPRGRFAFLYLLIKLNLKHCSPSVASLSYTADPEATDVIFTPYS